MESSLSRISVTFSLVGAQRFDQETGMFLSYCPALKIYAQGKDDKEAMDNLTSSVHLYIETCISRGITDRVLRDAGFSMSNGMISPNEAASEYIGFEVAKYQGTFPVTVPIELIAHQAASAQCQVN